MDRQYGALQTLVNIADTFPVMIYSFIKIILQQRAQRMQALVLVAEKDGTSDGVEVQRSGCRTVRIVESILWSGG